MTQEDPAPAPVPAARTGTRRRNYVVRRCAAGGLFRTYRARVRRPTGGVGGHVYFGTDYACALAVQKAANAGSRGDVPGQGLLPSGVVVATAVADAIVAERAAGVCPGDAQRRMLDPGEAQTFTPKAAASSPRRAAVVGTGHARRPDLPGQKILSFPDAAAGKSLDAPAASV